MIKRFISYILTVSVLLSMLVVNVSAADEGIAAERVTKFENALTLLTKIGAISEEETIEFDSGISKGKFVDIMSKIVPVSDGSLVPAFQDVPASHEYFNVIQGFADAGYINGHAGSFDPDRDITYNEALYIVLNAMGYKDFMGVIGTYPTGGWKIADQLDFKMRNKGAVAGDIFYMVYQALVTDMLEITSLGRGTFTFSNIAGETLLEKYHEITDTKGVLQSNGHISLVGGQPAEDGVVIIDGVTYRTEDPCEILAGCRVDVFYDMETNDLVCILEASENTVVEINSADLEGFMDGKFIYREEGNRKTLKLNDQTEVVKNNVLITELPSDESFMEPVNGKIIAINNGKGSGYNVIYIKDYTSFLVRGVEKDITSITLKADSIYALDDVVVYLENNEPAVYDVEGNRISPEDITIGTVVSVMGNVEGEKMIAEEIVTSNTIVTGTLTTIYRGREPYLLIDDVEYPIAASIATKFMDTISPQMDMTFFTDFMGNIVALDDSISGSMAYGYLISSKKGTNDDGDPCVILEVFSEIGSTIKYKLSNKRAQIDTDSYKNPGADENLVEHILVKHFPESSWGKLIRYDVNNDREINKVDTALLITDTTSPEPTVDNRLYQSLNNITGTDSTITQFYGSKKAFGDKIHVDEDTLIFKLPDLSGFEAEADDSEYKIIRNIGGLKDGRYGVTAYKLGKDMMHAKVVVIRELLNPSLSTDHIGNMIVTKVTQVVNEYNEPTYQINLLGMNGEKTYLTKSASVAENPYDLKDVRKDNRIVVPGDIVRCYLTEDETSIAKIAICYDIQSAGITDTSRSTTNWVSDNGTFGAGYVYAMDDKRVGIASGTAPADGTILEDNEFSTYLTDSFKIFKVDIMGVGSNKMARDITQVDKSELKSFKLNGKQNCSKVVAISSRGTGQMLFILNDPNSDN